MALLFKEVTYPLSLLIESIDMGTIALPDIQRPFIWSNTKVRDLFDSMYNGFPVGYLLFWSNDSQAARPIGVLQKQKVASLLIVDGQQRLTSLFAVIKGREVVRSDYSRQRIPIAFRPRDGLFDVTDAAIARDPEWIPDIHELWSGKAPLFHLTKSFIEVLRGSKGLSSEEEDQATEALSRLHGLLNYPFSALELSPSLGEEQVAEIFVRVNSKGQRLNQADFILTLMSVFWDEGHADLEKFCYQARQPVVTGPSPFNHFIRPAPDQLLRVAVGLAFRRARLQSVYAILRGKDLETEQFSSEQRDTQFALLRDAQAYVLDLGNWHDFLTALVKAGYRSSWMISSQTAILYAYLVYLVGRRDFGVDPHLLRKTVARWFFMSSLTARYSSSAETQMEADLSRLRGAASAEDFVSALLNVCDDALTDDYWNITLPNQLSTAAARAPGLYAYYAALSLLDAKVLFSDLKVSELLDPSVSGPKSAVERHHLFPRGYLNKTGFNELSDINQIANYALLEWRDNADITDQSPSDYMRGYYSKMNQAAAYWHALPEGWDNMAYPDFLAARRSLMARVIRDGYSELR